MPQEDIRFFKEASLPAQTTMDLRWIFFWSVFFVLLILGVVFVCFGLSGQVPWGSCPEATRPPARKFWSAEYRNESETPLCDASRGERIGCGIGGVAMLLVALALVRVHAVPA